MFLLLFVLAVLSVGWFFLSRRKPVEPVVVDHPRLVPGVIVHDVTFYSQALSRDMRYRVFLPQDAAGRKLPVVYLLHGGGGSFHDWSNYSDVANYAAEGMLLVMPQGDYSYYTNAAGRLQDRYEDYIVNDLTADVESRFPARVDRGGRAIAGVSMGGFGVVKLALDHPQKYAFAGALSAAIDVPRRRFTWRRLSQSRSYEEIFGPDGSDSRRASDPFRLVANIDPKTVPYIYLTCGRQEGLLAPNREFAALLERYKIAHEFHDVPGGHDWNQWNAQLPGLFEALRRHLELPDRDGRTRHGD
ncbi:MAG TPA: alpha/beta hydrolase-fold protein [Candidatus Angelobacter sp.]